MNSQHPGRFPEHCWIWCSRPPALKPNPVSDMSTGTGQSIRSSGGVGRFPSSGKTFILWRHLFSRRVNILFWKLQTQVPQLFTFCSKWRTSRPGRVTWTKASDHTDCWVEGEGGHQREKNGELNCFFSMLVSMKIQWYAWHFLFKEITWGLPWWPSDPVTPLGNSILSERKALASGIHDRY